MNENKKRKIKLSILQIIVISIISLIILSLLIVLAVDLGKYRLKENKTKTKYDFEEGELLVKPDPLLSNNTLMYKKEYEQGKIAEFYFDYKTTNVTVKKDGKVFETIPTKDNSREYLRSPISCTYTYRGQKVLSILNGYDASVKGGHYEVFKLKDGVRVEYEFAERKIDKTWIPHQFLKAEFNKILKENPGLVDILKSIYDYKESLEIVKRKETPSQDKLEIVYNLLLNKYKITLDEVIKRNKVFNPEHSFIKYPKFVIPVEYRLLNDGNLGVNVLTDRIKELSPQLADKTLKLCDVILLPTFVRTSEANNPNDFLFIPDGQGAIIKPSNVLKDDVNLLMFYQNDSLLVTEYNKVKTTPKNVLPFFGASNSSCSVLADIKTGVANASLETKKEDKYYRQAPKFNLKAFSDYEFVKDQKIKFYEDILLDERIEMKYYLIPKENSGYFDFVKEIQKEYFKDLIRIDKNSASFEFEILGAFQKKKHILGIPYYSVEKLTSYEEFFKIKEIYKNKNIIYKYSGFSKGGINGTNQEVLRREKKLGKWSLFKQVLDDENTFLDTYLIEHYFAKEGHFKNRRHGISTIGGRKLKFGFENRRDLLLDEMQDEQYYLLAPNYLNAYVDIFIRNNKDAKNIALRDLGNRFLRNYTVSVYSGDLAIKTQAEALKKLKEANKKLILRNPMFHYAKYATYLEDVSLETSEKFLTYSHVPFVQLLFSPYMQIYSNSINLYEDRKSDVMLARALLANTNLKYSLSYSNTSESKDTKYYNRIYATNIFNDILKEDIEKRYTDALKFYNLTDGAHIKEHRLLDSEVFLVKYENDKEIIFNFSDNTIVEYNGIFYEIRKNNYKEI